MSTDKIKNAISVLDMLGRTKEADDLRSLPSLGGGGQDLDELERLAKAATGGPWYATYSDGVVVWSDSPEDGYPIAEDCDEEDAAYIAAANPAAILALTAELRSLRAAASTPPLVVGGGEQAEVVWPAEPTEALMYVLGRPNFWCGPYARKFRNAGHPIPEKAEAEQAFILHWLTGLVLKHGDKWSEVAQAELKALAPSTPANQKDGKEEPVC